MYCGFCGLDRLLSNAAASAPDQTLSQPAPQEVLVSQVTTDQCFSSFLPALLCLWLVERCTRQLPHPLLPSLPAPCPSSMPLGLPFSAVACNVYVTSSCLWQENKLSGQGSSMWEKATLPQLREDFSSSIQFQSVYQVEEEAVRATLGPWVPAKNQHCFAEAGSREDAMFFLLFVCCLLVFCLFDWLFFFSAATLPTLESKPWVYMKGWQVVCTAFSKRILHNSI